MLSRNVSFVVFLAIFRIIRQISVQILVSCVKYLRYQNNIMWVRKMPSTKIAQENMRLTGRSPNRNLSEIWNFGHSRDISNIYGAIWCSIQVFVILQPQFRRTVAYESRYFLFFFLVCDVTCSWTALFMTCLRRLLYKKNKWTANSVKFLISGYYPLLMLKISII